MVNTTASAWKVPYLNLGSETNNPDWSFALFSSAPPGRSWNNTLQMSY
jgi:hypothetical protein